MALVTKSVAGLVVKAPAFHAKGQGSIHTFKVRIRVSRGRFRVSSVFVKVLP